MNISLTNWKHLEARASFHNEGICQDCLAVLGRPDGHEGHFDDAEDVMEEQDVYEDDNGDFDNPGSALGWWL